MHKFDALRIVDVELEWAKGIAEVVEEKALAGVEVKVIDEFVADEVISRMGGLDFDDSMDLIVAIRHVDTDIFEKALNALKNFGVYRADKFIVAARMIAGEVLYAIVNEEIEKIWDMDKDEDGEEV